MAAQIASAITATTDSIAGRQTSCHRIPLLSSARGLFHPPERRFQFLRYPVHSLRAAASSPPPPPPPPPPSPSFTPVVKLYVSGLSFRTNEESLRNAFEQFGQLTEVKLVMDKIANRPKGFAFLCYATEEEALRAIDGMHGKFLHGRVIFVEVAKPRSQVRKP